MFWRSSLIPAVVLVLFFQIWHPMALSQQSQPPDKTTQQPPAVHDETEIPLDLKEPEPVNNPKIPEIKIPNYAFCELPELRQAVPELAHLSPAKDQSQLAAVLDKMGAKLQEIVRKTPNLISDESVVSEQSGTKTHQKYSYLVVRHDVGTMGAVFDEFRVDPATGAKFETQGMEAAKASNANSLPELPTTHISDLNSYGAPSSQGFANEWLHFYPQNRGQSDFRYLGEQDMDRHHTLVVAFAEKPTMVAVPGTMSYGDRTYNLYRQGVAWVDASDFRVVRLRSDILAAPREVPLRQLTADVQFAEIVIAQFANPLWLPLQVVVTSNLAGYTSRETHVYSRHRLFHAQSKIVLNP